MPTGFWLRKIYRRKYNAGFLYTPRQAYKYIFFVYFSKMDIDYYENIKISVDVKTFSFISKGPRGELIKLVKFINLQHLPGTHNLALGTIRGDKIDYTETTDNGDRNYILATIFHIALIFSRTYPDQKIFIMGRDEVTTRLYRGAINHSYVEIVSEFSIYGGIYSEKGDRYEFEEFIRDKQYGAFLFKRR
jgi:hypothetical protein